MRYENLFTSISTLPWGYDGLCEYKLSIQCIQISIQYHLVCRWCIGSSVVLPHQCQLKGMQQENPSNAIHDVLVISSYQCHNSSAAYLRVSVQWIVNIFELGILLCFFSHYHCQYHIWLDLNGCIPTCKYAWGKLKANLENVLYLSLSAIHLDTVELMVAQQLCFLLCSGSNTWNRINDLISCCICLRWE